MARAAARFGSFVAIDWSGAVGERHRSIAIAVADGAGGAPVLLQSPRGWSRGEVLDLLRHGLAPASAAPDCLLGLDLGISLPFADRGAFFPGWQDSPRDAKSLWALVERICAQDAHLAASSFVDHPVASRYFRRHGGREGAHFAADGTSGGRGRFRVTEQAQALQGCKPYSNFNLVGAAQVGKSSLTGMRVLHALDGALPVWPLDPLPATGSAVVEIYTALAAIAAGRSASASKIRTGEDLDRALVTLGSPPTGRRGAIDDHSADALVTAAWLRAHHARPGLWTPAGMSADIARTEGWTFGVA